MAHRRLPPPGRGPPGETAAPTAPLWARPALRRVLPEARRRGSRSGRRCPACRTDVSKYRASRRGMRRGEAVQFLIEDSEFAAVTPGAPAGGADRNKGPGPAIRRRQTPAGDLDTMTVRSRSISRSTRAFGSICMRERALPKCEGLAQIDILHGTYARACRDVRRRWPFGNGPRQVALQWSGERAHLGKPGNSLLIALVAVVVVPLAGIGFIIYLGIKHRSGVLILLGALDGIILIQAALVPPARSASLRGR